MVGDVPTLYGYLNEDLRDLSHGNWSSRIIDSQFHLLKSLSFDISRRCSANLDLWLI